MNILHRRKQDFLVWWRSPVTPRDRFLGAVVGGFGFFWIGGLGRLIWGPGPVSMANLVWWALGFGVAGLAFGILFPKTTTCVAYPFSSFG